MFFFTTLHVHGRHWKISIVKCTLSSVFEPFSFFFGSKENFSCLHLICYTVILKMIMLTTGKMYFCVVGDKYTKINPWMQKRDIFSSNSIFKAYFSLNCSWAEIPTTSPKIKLLEQKKLADCKKVWADKCKTASLNLFSVSQSQAKIFIVHFTATVNHSNLGTVKLGDVMNKFTFVCRTPIKKLSKLSNVKLK